jgi:hypothetical protein
MAPLDSHIINYIVGERDPYMQTAVQCQSVHCVSRKSCNFFELAWQIFCRVQYKGYTRIPDNYVNTEVLKFCFRKWGKLETPHRGLPCTGLRDYRGECSDHYGTVLEHIVRAAVITTTKTQRASDIFCNLAKLYLLLGYTAIGCRSRFR